MKRPADYLRRWNPLLLQQEEDWGRVYSSDFPIDYSEGQFRDYLQEMAFPAAVARFYAAGYRSDTELTADLPFDIKRTLTISVFLYERCVNDTHLIRAFMSFHPPFLSRLRSQGEEVRPHTLLDWIQSFRYDLVLLFLHHYVLAEWLPLLTMREEEAMVKYYSIDMFTFFTTKGYRPSFQMLCTAVRLGSNIFTKHILVFVSPRKVNTEELPLILAAQKLDLPTFRILLSYNADINARDSEGKSVLEVVLEETAGKDVERSRIEFLEEILRHNVDVISLLRGGRYPLLVALEKKFPPPIIVLLISLGADVNFTSYRVDRDRAMTPLRSIEGNDDAISAINRSLLLSYGAQ